MASPPTLGAVRVSNPATSIVGGVLYPAIASAIPNTTYFGFRGGLWQRKGSSFPDTLYAAPYVPSGGRIPCNMAVEFDYYGAKFEFGYKGQATTDSRLWVDGVPAEAVLTTDVTYDGAYHLRPVTFAAAGWHRIKVETTYFYGIYAGPTDVVQPPPAYTEKLLVIGDSYTEGTGANPFDGYAAQVARILGFPEILNLSQGGTGVLAVNGGQSYPKYRDRAGDWSGLGATTALVGMSINDGSMLSADMVTELNLLLPIVKAIPGIRDVWVVGYCAQGGGNVAAKFVLEAAQSPTVTAAGIPYVSLLAPAPLWTGTGSAEAPAADGTSDIMWHGSGGLSQHPTVAGHQVIAQAFVERLYPYLPTA